MINLFLTEKDIPFLTSISGNVDIDSLKPHIYTAQTTDIKRILGIELYNKIYADFVADNLTGVYATILNDYVIDMLVYFSCSYYVQFGGYKIANQGIYKSTADGGTAVDYKEISALGSKYRQLGANVENNFRTFIAENPVAEYATRTEDTNIAKWY
jgi:hypothetical protein